MEKAGLAWCQCLLFLLCFLSVVSPHKHYNVLFYFFGPLQLQIFAREIVLESCSYQWQMIDRCTFFTPQKGSMEIQMLELIKIGYFGRPSPVFLKLVDRRSLLFFLLIRQSWRVYNENLEKRPIAVSNTKSDSVL